MANVLQTAPQDWKYVSEGGATIVFSYVGPSQPALDGMVLRLRKTALSAANLVHEVREWDFDSADPEDEPDDPSIEYQVKCMQRLIPAEHLPRLQTVTIRRSWLEAFSVFHNPARPEGRRIVDEVDLTKKKGVLATDLVGGHWLAVEIKPKWAFLASPTYLSDETKGVKTQTCRFCMHTHLRTQQGSQEITEYCPLDLFSGDECRILKAIHSLWNAWVASNATINNLKIFAEGKFLTPSECQLMFADRHAAGLDLKAIGDAFASTLIQPLLRTPLLRILSDLQRNLDPLDIEGLSKLWKLTESTIAMQTLQGSDSVPPYTPLGGRSPFFQSAEPHISEWIDFLDTYGSTDRPDAANVKPSPEDLRYFLLAYLLSATFKDCSVVVKLDFLQPYPQSTGTISSDSVTVIDLDPKKMSKLKGWEKLDAEIVRAYALANQKTCIDAWKSPQSVSSSQLTVPNRLS
ncbi:hypothetical protein HYPSUDRAFT_131996 [Hypholoma sublateritium FD-334 SS-4]|uniref:Inositol-pentakisphosphate 2-kinase n=1 Tax=Hypholoma sublateritium (strain FD-334 SS-4) TaxID=945553 RepID=A0A0D2P828_HYPSF|nr:hypothetical protein HYPSUDRAFT_131996 [Hypholoma sublateritium FD-334 SS-4]